MTQEQWQESLKALEKLYTEPTPQEQQQIYGMPIVQKLRNIQAFWAKSFERHGKFF